jgi:hypothetical protein
LHWRAPRLEKRKENQDTQNERGKKKKKKKKEAHFEYSFPISQGVLVRDQS